MRFDLDKVEEVMMGVLINFLSPKEAERRCKELLEALWNHAAEILIPEEEG